MKNRVEAKIGSLVVMVTSVLAASAPAQSFSVLHNFAGYSDDGKDPLAMLAVAGGRLYGTTAKGGGGDVGAIFVLQTDGTGFAIVHGFAFGGIDPALAQSSNGYVEYLANYTNSEGVGPTAGLAPSGDTLYGTAQLGGTGASGTVFKINTNGSGFTILKTFSPASVDYTTGNYTNSDGAEPFAGLLLAGNTLYGTTQFGGTVGNGTVFRVNTDGTGFAVLHPFGNAPDGEKPYAGLAFGGGVLYGTTQLGGTDGDGLIFAVDTNGFNYQVLHNFTNEPDGASPIGGMVLAGGMLFGTTADGGGEGRGSVFQINTNGTGYSVIQSFNGEASPPTVSDGANPFGNLTLVGNTLYGTAFQEGILGAGTVFGLNTNGTGFTVLESFSPVDSVTYTNAQGAEPYGGVVMVGNTLYGTAEFGGPAADGTLFKIELSGGAPGEQLNIQGIASQVVLSWANSGFTLQSAPAVSGTYIAIKGATSPYTNAITGSEQFFRLTSP